MSDGDYSERSSAPESGCGTKLLLGLGIATAVGVVLLCAGGYFMYQKMKDSVTNDPVEVQKISDEIVSVDLPDRLEAQFGMVLKVAGQGMSMAIFGDEDASVFVMSISAPYDPESADVDNVRRDMEAQQANKPAEQRQKALDLEEREEIEKDVNGRPGKFLVGRGKDENGVEHIQVLGIFESGLKEMGMMNLVIPAERMDMEGGRKLVESIE